MKALSWPKCMISVHLSVGPWLNQLEILGKLIEESKEKHLQQNTEHLCV